MARKGQFKKGGGRVGGGGGKRKRRKSTSIVHVHRSYPAKRRSGGRRRRGGGGGVPIIPLAIAAAGIGFLAGDNSPIKQIPANLAKVPGAKTFGNPAMLGVLCLAANKFVKPNKWLRLAGYAGIAAAALGVGSKGSTFKWLGDDDMGYDDMGDDDMGDDDMGDDDMGDDDMGDDE